MTAIVPSEEVAEALGGGRPVVALETTLIAHGIPRPRNLDLARAIEAEVRAAGAVPATIGVVDGRVRVGLDAQSLRQIAEAPSVAKCSTRDLALVLGRRGLGATTVAATMYLAARSGIRVMATGGLGGVHRGGEASLDVSADLLELRRSPMMVVCSGAKIVLDLPRTLEVLESQGVAVVGHGTDDLPGFYCRTTGIPIPRVEGVAGLVDLALAQAALGWPSGIVVANPPPEAWALDRNEVLGLVEAALREARRLGIRGPAETPFLLAELARASEGRTVRVNESLVLANARLAAELAAALAVADAPGSYSQR
jgi:pseudouridine-5'-phosphate glycosidase